MSTETRIEAGRELDALVAVEVMGWTLEGSSRGTRRLRAPGRGVAAIKERGREWSYIGYPKPILPEWSTSNAGLEVLERMREQGWEWEIKSFNDRVGSWYCGLTRATRSVGRWEYGLTIHAPTLPHAICLAALEAVRAEVGVHPVLSGSVTGVMPPLTGSVTGVMPPLRAKE